MIVLVGFMGAGKSTVGRLLAARLGRRFVDSDHVIEERCGCTVQEFFAAEGESAFRTFEEATILHLLQGEGYVLALGGGALGSARVRRALADHDVVYLDTSLEEVIRRVGQDSRRPMLRSHDVHQLYADRLAVYAATATVVVPADRHDPEGVASDVLAALADAHGGAAPDAPGGTVSTTAAVVVVGPPGAGTTTVGTLAAARLGLECADVERHLEERTGRSVGDIFVDDGEGRYRELEREAALDLLATRTGVVVLGGGAVLDPAVAASLDDARVVFLDVGIADAAKRIGFDRSPALVLLNPRRSWIVQMEQRRPAYQRAATWTIDTAGRSAQDVADELVGLLEGEEA